MSQLRFTPVRLAILMALLAFAASLASGIAVTRLAADEIQAATYDKFQALFEVRRARLRAYLESVLEETRYWNKDRVMRQALIEFSQAFRALGPDATETLQRLYIHDNPWPLGQKDELDRAGDDSLYTEVHARYHYWLRHFLVHRGVYDVFLFDLEGNLVYTSFKELDYATNLMTGPYKDTDLGGAFRAAVDNPFPSYVAFFDFQPYAPSHGEPASFFASPVLDDAGKLLGVLAYQIPAERVDEIMQVTAGMGETGETYAVGPDLLMRSDSRFSEETTVLKTTVDTVAAREALMGQQGLKVIDDYRGIPVLSAYGPLDFEGVRWAVMAEIDEAELHGPVEAVQRRMLASTVAASLAIAALCAAGARLLAGREARS